MGYQALLFCPDEKTARTVTQVLSELEFNVEACAEPFAAVKKLMGQHFDAVVVDCDNEQNATLLFKSARNSTSNQGSLAVAVVEGQAGVAKAFRIGANLVLTKPINIEQAKGTLRVARGLLRKGEPAKPGAAGITASPTTSAESKSASVARLEAPPASSVISTMQARPEAVAALARTAAAESSHAADPDDDLLEIGDTDSVPTPSAAGSASPARKFITPSPSADRFLEAAVAPERKASFAIGLPPTLGSGAASAPAPARERHETRVDALPERSSGQDTRLKTAAVTESDSSQSVRPAPSFTFGGANAPAESSGGSTKIFLGIAAIAILAIGAYFGWAHFRGRASRPEAAEAETIAAPVATLQSRRPSGAQHSTLSAESKPSASLPSSDTGTLAVKGHTATNTSTGIDEASPSTKTSSFDSSAPSKTTDTADPDTAVQPLVVKNGKAPGHAKTGAAEAPAPSIIGIGTADAGASAPDLGSAEPIAPKPLLQTLNISQGVSRGLLIKKVQPVYPKNSLSLRIEGSVELLATVSKNGDIAQVKVLSGDSQLTKAAVDAVKQWKYKPYLLNGEPVEIQTQVTINFKLPK